jgi:hypothetical protein
MAFLLGASYLFYRYNRKLRPNTEGEAPAVASSDGGGVRCAFFDRDLHSMISLDPMPARLKLEHACDQWHSSRESIALTGWHCQLRPNTEGHGFRRRLRSGQVHR